MNRLFNKEFLLRIISVFVFIPIVILPIIYSNYVTAIIYLIFNAVILNETIEMKSKVKRKFMYNFYILLIIASFYIFLMLLITEKLSIFYLLITITIIWSFDTFSYLGGKIIGGIKLMPKISPGKTVSGLISGAVMTLILIEFLQYLVNTTLMVSVFYTLLVLILSFVGDTTVSLLKRYSYIKNTGIIMPGHGGLLDRFDSFIMVFFVIGIFYLIK